METFENVEVKEMLSVKITESSKQNRKRTWSLQKYNGSCQIYMI